MSESRNACGVDQGPNLAPSRAGDLRRCVVCCQETNAEEHCGEMTARETTCVVCNEPFWSDDYPCHAEVHRRLGTFVAFVREMVERGSLRIEFWDGESGLVQCRGCKRFGNLSNGSDINHKKSCRRQRALALLRDAQYQRMLGGEGDPDGGREDMAVGPIQPKSGLRDVLLAVQEKAVTAVALLHRGHVNESLVWLETACNEALFLAGEPLERPLIGGYPCPECEDKLTIPSHACRVTRHIHAVVAPPDVKPAAWQAGLSVTDAAIGGTMDDAPATPAPTETTR